MTFTYDQLAEYYGTSRTTFWRHLKKNSDKFVKTSTGNAFNETDALQISLILGFSIPDLKLNETRVSNSFKLGFK